jgi:hypothetical protein
LLQVEPPIEPDRLTLRRLLQRPSMGLVDI